jgi:hypothetical protein
MEMFSVTYISDFIARQVLRDACKTCVTPEVLLPASVFIYFKKYSDTEQSLTYPSEKLVETVGTAVTLMECMMPEVAHLSSLEQHITAAIKNSIDFEWMWCKRANRLKSETVRQRATRRKMKIMTHQ